MNYHLSRESCDHGSGLPSLGIFWNIFCGGDFRKIGWTVGGGRKLRKSLGWHITGLLLTSLSLT